MKKYLAFFLIITGFALYAGEFDLFEEGNILDPSIFKDFKYNKVRTSYSLYPTDNKKFGLSYSRYFTKKLGLLIEIDQSEYGTSFEEKSEFIVAGTYKMTKRARTWVFLGDLGLSFNDDEIDDFGKSKGFRINHLYGRFCIEYTFANGLGFDYSMVARMPLEFDVDSDVTPIHSIGLIYQF